MGYVLADIEWIEKIGIINPTQIAAVRVDEKWNTLGHFFERIKPKNEHFHQWKHVAYTGGMPNDFIYAKNVFRVLGDFDKWLSPDDIILWWVASGEKTYSALTQYLFKRSPSQKQLVLKEYLCPFLTRLPQNGMSAYAIAKEMGIKLEGQEHDSLCDVVAEIRILKEIGFPQILLEKEPTPQELPQERYAYDSVANLVHLTDGGCRYDKYATITSSLTRYIKKAIPPCPVCLKTEYEKIRAEMCRDTVKRMHCKFIYTPRSKVFHKPECGLIRITTDVAGCQKYDTAIKSGRIPCKRCNPTINDEQKPKPKKTASANKNRLTPKEPGQKPSRDVKKAIKRLEQAKAERASGMLERAKNDEERRDILVLTNTEFAFWAGAGYGNFHRRDCPRLAGLSKLTGFGKFSDAVSAGYSPCKTCRPTSKHDVNFSFPVTTCRRKNESPTDLTELCSKFGYRGFYDDKKYFYVETHAGKWRIDVTSMPITLKHINLVKGSETDDYHTQPRLFLSLSDVISYIHRHDAHYRRPC